MENSSNLKMCHVNCQSLIPHWDEFRMFFGDQKYHIVCLSETWLKPSISDDYLNLPGYHLFRRDRIGKSGGGVAFYISDVFKTTVLASSDECYSKKPEFLIAEVTAGTNKLLLATVYRPPKIGFLKEFEDTLLNFFTEYDNLIVVGDFNADLQISTHDSEHLRDFIESSNLHLVPYNPTHHLDNSSTWLDVCFVDDQEKICNFGQTAVPFLSAHDLIHVEYNIETESVESAARVCRDFRNFSQEQFLSDLGRQNWSSIGDCWDMDGKLGLFYDNLTSVLNSNAPLRSFTTNKTPAPWFTNDIRVLIKARNKALRLWRRKKTSVTKLAFKLLRNSVTYEIDKAKRHYYHSIFNNSKSSKETWMQLRNLGLVKNKGSSAPLAVSAEELNNHFSSVCTSDHPVVPADLGDIVYSDSKFYITDPTIDEFRTALSSITSNSEGTDGISVNIIKRALPCLSNIILYLFSFSLAYEVFPSQWKTAIICPIPKIKNPLTCSDYRPISLLCTLSKILEKIVAHQINKYLESTKKFDIFQSAYRKDHSSQTALIRILDEVKCAADKRMVTVMVFFDFSKAFDRVVHRKLIEILRDLGFSHSALNWILSYLSGRSHATKDHLGNVTSQIPINTGVPQGSVLGPLLFSLYIIGLSKLLSFCGYNIYADDIQIFISCYPKDLERTIQKVNEDITRIVGWAEDLGLLLNNAKTKAIIVGTSRYVNSINYHQLPKIRVDNTDIDFSDRVDYLGTIINSNLSWSSDVSRRSKRIFGTLHQLKLAKKILPIDVRKQLVSSLIFPVLDYCCVTMLDITKESELRLQRALNSCIRFIFSPCSRSEHITPYFTQLRWLKVHERRKFFEGCLIYTILQTQRPIYLACKFSFRSSMISTITRSDALLLNVPSCRTELYNKSFRIDGARLWNTLPLSIRSASSPAIFKQKFFKFLLDTAYN